MVSVFRRRWVRPSARPEILGVAASECAALEKVAASASAPLQRYGAVRPPSGEVGAKPTMSAESKCCWGNIQSESPT